MKNPDIEWIQAQVHGIGKYRVLMNVGALAECLLYHFPEEGRGPAHRAARQACVDAMEGTGTAEAAREAFIAAAEECGVVLREGRQ